MESFLSMEFSMMLLSLSAGITKNQPLKGFLAHGGVLSHKDTSQTSLLGRPAPCHTAFRRAAPSLRHVFRQTRSHSNL